MPELGQILTAIVTPFDSEGLVDEDAFVALMSHLAAHGSDGFVVAGTTGEAATLADEEHLRLIELAVQECPEGKTIVAGVGSNDTRHAIHLTERACELGPDALLSVNPYYNRPNERGIVAHYTEISKVTDRPMLLYNIPQRTGSNMGPELLARLAQLDHVEGLKQANNDELQLIDGLDIYAGNDDILGRTLDMGGAGGVLVASHIVGDEMRRMVDEPENRAEIEASLHHVYEALSITPAAISTKASLNMLGLPGGTLRLPYIEATDDEIQTLRAMLVKQGLLETAAT
jgi:4-hydroxy-tetrahydrodipicolinate synthase